MKTLQRIGLLFLITITVLFVKCSDNNKRLIGEWKGSDNEQVGSMILDNTNHAVIVVGNQVMGGKDFEINGVKAECKYVVDFTKDPIWLDIVIYEVGKTEEISRMKGIVKFITDNKIEYRLNFEGDRFDKFDPEDTENTMVLDRVLN